MIDGQNITQNDLPGFEGEAYAIIVHNSDVYVGGYYSHADGMICLLMLLEKWS